MAPRTDAADVVVVGAGLAGLAAALTVHEAGHEVIVLEAGDDVGGRVRTDIVDGFRLDHGFQILNPAYPALRQLADVRALQPRRLWRALRVVDRGRARIIGDPLDSPLMLADLLRRPLLARPRDIVALLAMSTRDATAPAHLLTGAADQSTRRELARWGFSDLFVERVMAPLLRGVFGEAELATSSRFFHLMWRCFMRAAPFLPAEGVAALPRQLAARLPRGALRLNTPVSAVRPGHVTTDDGATHRARAVVVATDADVAARLLPGLDRPAANGLQTFYFATEEPPLNRPVVSVDARGGPVVSTLVNTAVAPSYAPPGWSLIGATTLLLGRDGEEGPEERAVRAHLDEIYAVSTAGWDLVAEYPVPRALPRMLPPHPLRRPVRLDDGLYVCGDHRDTSSMQGALASGQRAARAVLRDLDVPPPE
jgi:phytoene dehydrogenase-like protein